MFVIEFDPMGKEHKRNTPNSRLLHSFSLHEIDVKVYSRLRGIPDQQAVDDLVAKRVDGKKIDELTRLTPRGTLFTGRLRWQRAVVAETYFKNNGFLSEIADTQE